MIVFPGLTPSKAFGGMGIASVVTGFAFRNIFQIPFPYSTLTFKDSLRTQVVNISKESNEEKP